MRSCYAAPPPRRPLLPAPILKRRQPPHTNPLQRAVTTAPRAPQGVVDNEMHERISLQSIETRSSWMVATAVLVILAVSFGAPWITIVALKLIAAETDGLRSVPALANSFAWVGYGLGGIVMGYIAERVGVRWT